MENKNEFKSVCDVCGRKTWYEKEQQCHCSYSKKETCKTCGHTEEVEPHTMERCTGTLRLIDNSKLNPAFTPYYGNGVRVEVDFGYEKKRGTIGKTMGWKPVYLLMLRKNSTGSSYTIGMKDKIVKVISY